MKKTMILLAGYPGTGKSYLANIIRKSYLEFQMLSPDDIKEEFWDKYGFSTLEEKEMLILWSWDEYYRRMERAFSEDISLISDYPFSNKQKGVIEEICSKYGYSIITIRLVGDIGILYERQRQRDLNDSRHLGHIVSCYHKSAKGMKHQEADNLLTYEEFYKRCTQRGYGEFSLGNTIEVDVSDYDSIDYRKILSFIKKYMNSRKDKEETVLYGK